MSASHSLPITPAYFAHPPARDTISHMDLSVARLSMQAPPRAIELSTLSSSWSRASNGTELPTTTDRTTSALLLPSRSVLKYRLALYLLMFVEGWNDATAGPLLPSIQRAYGLTFTIVSMLFVASAIVSYLSHHVLIYRTRSDLVFSMRRVLDLVLS